MAFAAKVTSSQRTDPHCWIAYSPDGASWLADLAAVYRALRTATKVPLAAVELDGITFSTDLIQQKLADACLPTKGVGHLRVERSDFAETISYCLLADVFKTRIGYKSVRDRELIQFPGRGIDAIGIEVEADNDIRLVLGETKLSDEAASPPQVVDSGKDCLRKQHLAHIHEIDVTAKKILDAARRADDQELQQLLVSAAIYLQNGDWSHLKLTTYCCLVRPQDKFKSTDCGSFQKSPNDFKPGHVRFTTFVVPSDVESVVDQWLELAKAG